MKKYELKEMYKDWKYISKQIKRMESVNVWNEDLDDIYTYLCNVQDKLAKIILVEVELQMKEYK